MCQIDTDTMFLISRDLLDTFVFSCLKTKSKNKISFWMNCLGGKQTLLHSEGSDVCADD